jgi:hypothetical protein
VKNKRKEKQKARKRKGVVDLSGRGSYLLLNVVQWIRGIDGEANQDDMGIGITQGSKSIVVFLSRRIPKGQFDVFSIYLDVRNVILKHSRNIDLSPASVSTPQNTTISPPREHPGQRQKREWRAWYLWEGALGKDTVGEVSFDAVMGAVDGGGYIKRHVLPHAPSPTMTSFLRIDSVMAKQQLSRAQGESAQN